MCPGGDGQLGLRAASLGEPRDAAAGRQLVTRVRAVARGPLVPLEGASSHPHGDLPDAGVHGRMLCTHLLQGSSRVHMWTLNKGPFQQLPLEPGQAALTSGTLSCLSRLVGRFCIAFNHFT